MSGRARNYPCRTLNPEDPSGPKIDAVFPHALYSKLYKYSPVRYENLRAAKYVLENPERIFSGIREYETGGWCYTGRPEVWYVKPDVEAPFPEDKVFAVYMRTNMLIFECRAVCADDIDPMCPVGWEDRYGGLIWKNTS